MAGYETTPRPEERAPRAAVPRPKVRRGTWILAALGVVAVVVAVGVFAFADAVRKRGDLTKSKDNVRNLVTLHLDMAAGGRGFPPVGGKAFVLWPFATLRVRADAPGALEAFLGPAERGAHSRARPEEYRALTTERLLSGADVRHLTSYVGRRHYPDGTAPAREAGSRPMPLIADLQFEDGAIVGFADGSVEWLTRAQLGLAPGDPIVVGPTSKSPILRQLSE